MKVLGRDRLRFGLDIVDANGQLMGIYGTARRQGSNAWRYRSDMTDSYARCEITIRNTPTGAIVSSSSGAACKANGGYGTEIGVVVFSQKYLQKRVTFELDSPDAFFSAHGPLLKCQRCRRSATMRAASAASRVARLMLLTTICSVLAGSAAPCRDGSGDAIHKPITTGNFTAFQSLSHFGDDGFRVTYSPSLGGSWSIELHPVSPDWAEGEIVFYAPVHNGETFTGGDEQMRFGGWIGLRMSRRRYDALVAKIDAEMAKPDPPIEQSPSPPTELVICTDGADYLTERRKRGQTTWLSLNSCDDSDRYEDIPRLVLQAFPDLQCWIFPHDTGDACYPKRLPEDE